VEHRNRQATEQIRHALARSAFAAGRQRAALSRILGVTDSEVLAIQQLASVGELTPSQLSVLLQLSSGGTTALIHRLERAGHLVRRPHPGDRRSAVLRLSPAIERRLEHASAPLAHELDALIDRLDETHRETAAVFLSAVAEVAERDADRLVSDADATAIAALAVPAPAQWA